MNSVAKERNPHCPVWSVLTLLCLSGLLPSLGRAATYTVDGDSHNARDTNPGTERLPWKTISRATASLQPGDTVLVKAGTYRETIVLTKSGTAAAPITISVYPGDEGKVIINAAELVTTWNPCIGPDDCRGNPNWSHIYYADVADLVAAHPDKSFAVRQVFQRGERLSPARYPDTGWSYATAIADPKTTFSDSTLKQPGGYFDGAMCHIKTAMWRIDQVPIAHSAGPVITLATPPLYDISTRFGYYITSIVGEINEAGEWAYDPALRRVYLWPKAEKPEEAEFTYRQHCLLACERVSFNTVRGFTMRNAYTYGIWLYLANNMTLEDNIVEYVFTYGIHLQGVGGSCNNNQIVRNTIRHSGYRAINVSDGAAQCNIEGNIVYATGVEHFGGDLMNGPSEGVYISGAAVRVYNNRIDRTGNVGLYLHGAARNREVSHNHVSNSGLALSDTAGLYTDGFCDGPEQDYIHHNIIEDTFGCRTMDRTCDRGTPVTVEAYAGDASGIYIDEEGNNRIIENNTVTGSRFAGIFFHGAPGNRVRKNTLYGNHQMQVLLVGRDYFDGRPREHMKLVDDILRDNVLFATDARQRTLFVGVYYDDIHFGQSDGNYFYNPYAGAHIQVERYIAGQTARTLPLAEWSAMSGYDGNSREFSCLRQRPDLILSNPVKSTIVYNASLDVNIVDLGPELYCDVKGDGVPRGLTLQPFESKVLIAAAAAVVPRRATDPVPADGGQVEDARVLQWTAAGGAAFHDVYLGTDANAVEAADLNSPLYRGRQTGGSFSLTRLVQPGTRYFWRVDEVEANGTTIHKGTVWTFTTAALLVIDDFESYADSEGSRIEGTWSDGSINHTGSQVGLRNNPSIPGSRDDRGKSSMLLAYDNAEAPFISEVEREFDPAQDWTLAGTNTLSLWLQAEATSFAETAPGTFVMSAAGTDIWGARDEFRYAYQQLDGDGIIVAKIERIVETDLWTKAGVMIRESLDPASAHASMFVIPMGLRAFQNRPINNASQCFSAHSWEDLKIPSWVKLERKGNRFTGYHSPDGVTWTPQSTTSNPYPDNSPNPQTINMPRLVCIGLALTSHAPGTATTATFSGVKITGNVAGPWQVADIGADHPGNSLDDLYVTVEDSDGRIAVGVNPDPAAVNGVAWTQWQIPLADLVGVDLSRVRKLSIGVGSGKAATGDGRIYIDDIQVQKQ